MLSTSFEFRSKISENSKVLFKATLTLADGTVKDLVGDDFMMGSMSFSDAVSSSGSFDIGAAIINKLDFTLNNYDRRFDDYVFTDSTIVPYVGVQLDSGDVEWLMKGHYGVEQPESYGSTIGLTALDNMRLLEVPYSEVATQYPASLRTIVMDVCRHCGVSLLNTDFVNNGFVVPIRPDDDALTCLEVVGYAAQASGNYARCAASGQLAIDWYDTKAREGEDWLDGDRFDDDSPYSSGDAAEGGNFVDYGSGDTYDGGEFGASAFANVYAYSSATVATDDVVITGIRVTAQDGLEEDGETALYGSEGYVLAVEGNPLIQFGEAAAAAAQIGARVVGMRFRPFDVSAVGNPAVEAGDPVILTDRLQNQYFSYITALTYKVGDYEAFACNAESPGRNKASSYSAATKAYVKMRNALKQEKTAREQATEELARELSESPGLYMSEDEQADGSTVYYTHDKPTLRESRIVWKLTANALGISTDGGETYPYGFDVSGNAILDRIYAIGIDADYLNTGRIASKTGDSYWDLVSGKLVTSGMVANNISANGALSSSTDTSRAEIEGGHVRFYSRAKSTDGWTSVGTLVGARRNSSVVSSLPDGTATVTTSVVPTLLFLTSSGKARFSVSDNEVYLGFPLNPENLATVYANDLKTGICAYAGGGVTVYAAKDIVLRGQGAVLQVSDVDFWGATLSRCQIDTATGGAKNGVSGTYTFLLANNQQVTLKIAYGMIVG